MADGSSPFPPFSRNAPGAEPDQPDMSNVVALFPDEAEDDDAPGDMPEAPILSLSASTPPPAAPSPPTPAPQGEVTGMQEPSVVPCFTAGTLVETDEGRVPVEELMPGDRVLTRDRGYRTLRWVGTRHVCRATLLAHPEFAPVRIARGALGGGLPERDMLVSPQHRMLVAGARAELLFGCSEVLVAARHLVGLPGIIWLPDTPVTYVHVLCDRHELVRADGCWSESFQPGDLSLGSMDAPQRAEILALFPELAGEGEPIGFASARMTLKSHEARALFAH